MLLVVRVHVVDLVPARGVIVEKVKEACHVSPVSLTIPGHEAEA